MSARSAICLRGLGSYAAADIQARRPMKRWYVADAAAIHATATTGGLEDQQRPPGLVIRSDECISDV